jgi:hypothetical protein
LSVSMNQAALKGYMTGSLRFCNQQSAISNQ